jgi:Putative zinc-finger
MRNAMSRELDDERISAYLDGELSAGERAEVEELLRTSSSQRQFLAELTSLRESLQSLPRSTLGNEFAPRVTLAAQRAARESAADARPQTARSGRNWLLVVAGGIAVAAASVALLVNSWSSRPGNIVQVEPKETQRETVQEPVLDEPAPSAFVRVISRAADNEAAVVRVKLTKAAIRGKLLDNALATHGIQMATADVNNEAARLTGLAYKDMLKSQTATPPAFRRGAADVVFLEADVVQLEKALLDLKQNAVAQAAFAPESLVASVGKAPLSLTNPEGEGGSSGPKTKIPAGGYYQHMPPHGFTLAPAAAPPALKPGEKTPTKKSARVLIVVEVVD